MGRDSLQLRADAERIWRAGVVAVLPERLIPEQVHVDGHWLCVAEDAIDLDAVERIAIVGAGKAAGAMAVALERVLGPVLLEEKRVNGWINVPADCVVPSQRVQLHPARPAGVNEPTRDGVVGTQRILEIVSSLGPSDICFCLFTGGGSALLPAPVPGVSLEDKIRLTRLLSGAGANIEQLNIVRRQLSLIKGGGLARACRAGQMFTLVISDVLGDRSDMIASGPTVAGETTAADALQVFRDLKLDSEKSIATIIQYLQSRALENTDSKSARSPYSNAPIILGNNATAVDGAGAEAERLSYSHAMVSATRAEGAAEDVGGHLASMALKMRDNPGPDCLISGGEPTVSLVDESRRGKGGRNQQLALAALISLGDCERICLLSGGTDGEDGPTDAAGALVTRDIVQRARDVALNPNEYLARNDAYSYFQRADGLFITGPTQTNVCDLRVVVVSQS